ncbi:GNAT family N-acetyltransferase [uncultured Psychroserpens sp.]|uniref:GNAT family N-acetyltransferase n=1 Tax=uncultured Psychroserpens sp. TaxID=255436 RepID=UPI002613DEC3|nr:GNAT family N-acetyltransferase [uncultured Psychroserpens sp.]
MTEIRAVKSKDDCNAIAQLANIIWREHYTPIIGRDQVSYMLDKFQSSEAIKQQIEDGYKYYAISYNMVLVGYLAIKKNDHTMFLSKIYISKDFRGLGIGKTALNFIDQEATNHACKTITLTVNRFNTNSINAYEKLGYIKTRTAIKDIGEGYVMDDYIMERTL